MGRSTINQRLRDKFFLDQLPQLLSQLPPLGYRWPTDLDRSTGAKYILCCAPIYATSLIASGNGRDAHSIADHCGPVPNGATFDY
jgi:hypothetical protein